MDFVVETDSADDDDDNDVMAVRSNPPTSFYSCKKKFISNVDFICVSF